MSLGQFILDLGARDTFGSKIHPQSVNFMASSKLYDKGQTDTLMACPSFHNGVIVTIVPI